LRPAFSLFYAAFMAEQSGEFYPKGAIAFFAAMVVFFAVVWVLFYALLIRRHG